MLGGNHLSHIQLLQELLEARLPALSKRLRTWMDEMFEWPRPRPGKVAPWPREDNPKQALFTCLSMFTSKWFVVGFIGFMETDAVSSWREAGPTSAALDVEGVWSTPFRFCLR